MLNKLMKNIKHPILITGASGFIGSNLTRYFIKKNYKINLLLRKKSNYWRINDLLKKSRNFYLDLCNKNEINDAINKIKPKTIFHLAAYGAYPFQNNFRKIKSVNLDSTIHLLQACEKHGFSKFINTGSSSEYGFKNKSMSENDILSPNSYYAVFKSAGSMYCQYEAITKKLPIVTIRPFHVYGPYEESSRFIPTLIMNFFYNKCPPLVSPNISRDMIFIDDVINYYLKASVTDKINGEILNLGSGKKTTIKQIFFLTKQLMQKKIEPEWGSMKNRKWDQNIWLANMKKTNKMLSMKVKFDLKIGLRKTIEWFLQNRNLYENNINQK